MDVRCYLSYLSFAPAQETYELPLLCEPGAARSEVEARVTARHRAMSAVQEIQQELLPRLCALLVEVLGHEEPIHLPNPFHQAAMEPLLLWLIQTGQARGTAQRVVFTCHDDGRTTSEPAVFKAWMEEEQSQKEREKMLREEERCEHAAMVEKSDSLAEENNRLLTLLSSVLHPHVSQPSTIHHPTLVPALAAHPNPLVAVSDIAGLSFTPGTLYHDSEFPRSPKAARLHETHQFAGRSCVTVEWMAAQKLDDLLEIIPSKAGASRRIQTAQRAGRRSCTKCRKLARPCLFRDKTLLASSACISCLSAKETCAEAKDDSSTAELDFVAEQLVEYCHQHHVITRLLAPPAMLIAQLTTDVLLLEEKTPKDLTNVDLFLRVEHVHFLAAPDAPAMLIKTSTTTIGAFSSFISSKLHPWLDPIYGLSVKVYAQTPEPMGGVYRTPTISLEIFGPPSIYTLYRKRMLWLLSSDEKRHLQAEDWRTLQQPPPLLEAVNALDGPIYAKVSLTSSTFRASALRITRTADMKARIQARTCKSLEDETLSWCRSCLGDDEDQVCRFEGRRKFVEHNGVLVGFCFTAPSDAIYVPKYRSSWAGALDDTGRANIRRAVAPLLFPIIQEEQAHLKNDNVVFCAREVNVRATCDTCGAAVFRGSWLCRNCGHEMCLDCYRERNLRPRKCPGTDGRHNREDFIPLSPVVPAFLARIEEDIQPFLHQQAQVPDVQPQPRPSLATFNQPTSYETRKIPRHELSQSKFAVMWAEGQPLIVTGATEDLQLDWDPAFLRRRYGQETCQRVDCQTQASEDTKLKVFLQGFGGNPAKRTVIWKVKDWPPTEDFDNKFPDLFEDFLRAAPVGCYMLYDGHLNLWSFLPLNMIRPDLGPKMYIAYANIVKADRVMGSTRLHLDMTDAFNICTFAGQTSDGRAGYAIWHIFRAEDTQALRDFLRPMLSEAEAAECNDPIHGQQLYLNDEKLAELATMNIFAHRIEQHQGEAVLIPAGCAHQVLNVSDCIKIAMDFVSPENLAATHRVTGEFRLLAGFEEVLQFKELLWHSWVCTSGISDSDRL
uniref:JmjC domain-containing protein n=1 Tax=Mycena chlorophos TaxID=658473 RepID=A0ABQ0M4H7_MYCCL|nr:predicted protein [Mycena chlorophos]